MNELRLSALTSFKFALYTSGARLCDPAMDFSRILSAHPLLTTVTLNIEGICVPRDVCIPFLSSPVPLKIVRP